MLYFAIVVSTRPTGGFQNSPPVGGFLYRNDFYEERAHGALVGGVMKRVPQLETASKLAHSRRYQCKGGGNLGREKQFKR